MFTDPKQWTTGESGIRTESFNKSVPNNLDAVRNLCSSTIAVASHYPGSTMNFQGVPDPASIPGTYSYFDFPATSYTTTNTSFWTGATVVGSRSQSGIVWIPMASLLAAKKSTESLYWNIEVTAEPIARQDPYDYIIMEEPAYWPPGSGTPPLEPHTYYSPGYGFVGPSYVTSKLAYQFIGSESQASPGAPERTIEWSSANSNSSSNRSATFGTGNVAIDTQDMSSTDVTICAFKLRFKLFGYVSSNYNFASVGMKNFTLRVTVGIA
jgi:hypothetical protein